MNQPPPASAPEAAAPSREEVGLGRELRSSALLLVLSLGVTGAVVAAAQTAAALLR